MSGIYDLTSFAAPPTMFLGMTGGFYNGYRLFVNRPFYNKPTKFSFKTFYKNIQFKTPENRKVFFRHVKIGAGSLAIGPVAWIGTCVGAYSIIGKEFFEGGIFSLLVASAFPTASLPLAYTFGYSCGITSAGHLAIMGLILPFFTKRA